MNYKECITAKQYIKFIEGEMNDDELDYFNRHLNYCFNCAYKLFIVDKILNELANDT